MKELTIQPQKEGKGRSFSAALVSYVEERGLLPRGNDTIRPVFLALAGTDNELRPFVANLRTGKKAEASYRGKERFEVMKSAGYQCTWQRTSKGALVTLFAPDLFSLDPGMVDPRGVMFVILPARRWLRPAGSIPVPECVPEERADDVRQLAPLFAAFLDRRTRCPLIPDPRFYVQLLGNALDEGIACWGMNPDGWAAAGWAQVRTFAEYGTDKLGLAPGVCCRVTHERLEEFLAQQVSLFFREAA